MEIGEWVKADQYSGWCACSDNGSASSNWRMSKGSGCRLNQIQARWKNFEKVDHEQKS
jgi:hypothetical protein